MPLSVVLSVYGSYAKCVSPGNKEETESLFKQYLEITRRHEGEASINVAVGLNNLASFYESQQRYSEAELQYMKAIYRSRKILDIMLIQKSDGEVDTNGIREEITQVDNVLLGEASKNNSFISHEAVNLHFQMEFEIPEHQLSLLLSDYPDIKARLESPVYMFAGFLTNLACLYYKQGDGNRCDQAMSLTKQAFVYFHRLLGEDQPIVVRSLTLLGFLYLSQENYDESESYFIKAKELAKNVYGSDHQEFARCLNNLGGCYSKQGDSSKAKPLYKQALQICEQKLVKDHPDSVNHRHNLDKLSASRGPVG